VFTFIDNRKSQSALEMLRVSVLEEVLVHISNVSHVTPLSKRLYCTRNCWIGDSYSSLAED